MRENCFIEIKNRIAKAGEKNHCNPQLETRLNYDASLSGLGAALKQLTVDGWKPIAFTCRFLNLCEERYSVNELELFGLFILLKFLHNYLYGKPFTVIKDHRALFFYIEKIGSNKSYNSRLTRWIDRLLLVQFDFEHLLGAKMGLVEYISRHPNQKAKKVSAYDEEFIVANLKLISASVSTLNTNSIESAIHLNKLI